MTNDPEDRRSGDDVGDTPGSSADGTESHVQDSGNHGGDGLIFCGMCGALNPAGRYYCAACGTTLVDAFHATEGLRVYERADSASRLIEIVDSGTELEIVEDPNASEDFVRVRLPYGRLGYIRLNEVEALAAASGAAPGEIATGVGTTRAPNINTNATGCISSTAALGAIALLAIVGILMLVLLATSDTYDQGTILLVFCFGLGPFMLLTIGIYLYARSREDRLADEAAERVDTT